MDKPPPDARDLNTAPMRLLFTVGLAVALGATAGVLVGQYLSARAGNNDVVLVGCIFAGLALGLVIAAILLLREVPWNR